jgi:single-stranded-DNA-specific exonuclease
LTPGEIVQAILTGRGIIGDAAVREFLSDRPQLAYDPLLFEDMEAGASLLLAAVADGRRVCVYGDYDVDGVCGVALLCRYLRDVGDRLGTGGRERIQYYIPSRIEEGYGLNREALDVIRSGIAFEDGLPADLVVTVDCGSVSAAEADYAREIGLEIIITDHHDLAEGLTPDCIFINPKRGGYPDSFLCGAAVAFKLCCAMEEMREHDEGQEKADRGALLGLIDLVCIATIADVMPLTGENRTLVKYGLGQIRRDRRPALKALFRVAGLDAETVSVRDIGFGIAPRINAAGRLSDAATAAELFLTDDQARMQEIAERIDLLNTERRGIQDECFRECMALYEAESEQAGAGPRFLMLKPAASHEGVSGIVAGKVREATGLPCAVLAETKDGDLKGSARSVGRLDLTSLLRGRAEYFFRLGGHAAAAGFSLHKEYEQRACEDLSSDLRTLIEADPGLLDEETRIDLSVDASDITPDLAEALGALAPFGHGNPPPELAFWAPAGAIAFVKTMGAKGLHVRFQASGIPCVWFSGAALLAALTSAPPGEQIEIIGCPEINVWNGRESLQLKVSVARLRGVV